MPPRILNITVPQVGHLPLMALRPFFIVSSTASMISFLALHLTQYPSGIRKICCRVLHCAAAVTGNSLFWGSPASQLRKTSSGHARSAMGIQACSGMCFRFKPLIINDLTNNRSFLRLRRLWQIHLSQSCLENLSGSVSGQGWQDDDLSRDLVIRQFSSHKVLQSLLFQFSSRVG